MIKIENLSKQYKKLQALKNISLHVQKGELLAYLGPNGAGKTTTIRILTGLTRSTNGTAFLNGFDIRKDVLKAKKQYGLVPQAINLDQELTVSENLYIHGRLYAMKTSDIKNRTDELLNYVEMLDRKNSLVKKLSGGMKRRLMIARALMHDPAILFLDEPTVGLDASIRRKIWALIKKIQQHQTTIFLTTHYIEEAEFLAQRVAFLDEGQIITVDTPQNLIDRQGQWAIDRIVNDQMETVYFQSRESANQYNSDNDTQYTLRRVNLEDSFLAITGKKVK
ncbi:MAG: antibiotic transport system ATP-binding protein [Candidatus Magnetoglobus multicellularis str. Araruama]|uniref:Antibiotic transport system ATP-binding protein n=1 Tax=Candidatus Magnetoglobus multicellularis str. Araruama TaxID=890399 RepID=A0A1V1PCV9_9BACT|nr:MAG: antibiotic transport system ATP-binding protein [Candidatus Magnetoglobus multicellularis str. Araruama]